jgi:hypothetical protein
MAMVRKQVYITKNQDEKLKELASELRLTEAELIRRAIDRLDEAPENERDWDVVLKLVEKLTRRRIPAQESLPVGRADIYKDYPRHLDPDAWLEELVFIEERERLLPAGGSTQHWRREESYDEPRFSLPG